MDFKKASITFSIAAASLTFMYNPIDGIRNELKDKATAENLKVNYPASMKMYDAIMKYSDMYDIPKKYAFGIAFMETTYQGPYDTKYNHKRKSRAGAVGPMQIMPATAKMMWKGRKFTKNELMTDIDFNVETSMKLLRHLHNRYGNWKKVFGCYNTGRPIINKYALKVYNHKIDWNI